MGSSTKMTKRFAFQFVGLILLILPQTAMAADYGGGLFEYLLTGHDPSASGSTTWFDSVTQSPPSVPVPAPDQASSLAPEPEPALAPAPVQGTASVQPSAYSAEAEPSAVEPVVNPIYLRKEVTYSGPEKPGTIVIDTPNKFLFLVEKGGKALRYGIGVGRPGFTWAGVKAISRKVEWPDWTPPPEMLLRRPDLPTHMDGGPANPLGARALYLGSSLYRIHGTNQPETIGTNVSSGCIRMMNGDVIDLYNRVGVGTKVIVM
jgi:lipoprotein-anchoring transpeptidase ErfK/SrfK